MSLIRRLVTSIAALLPAGAAAAGGGAVHTVTVGGTLVELAVPQGMRPDGLPHGVTLIAPGGRDAWLSSVGQSLEQLCDTPLGASRVSRPKPQPCCRTSTARDRN